MVFPMVFYMDISHFITKKNMTGWWFGWHQFYFPRNLGNFIIPIDELIFFRGVAQPPTRLIATIFVGCPHWWCPKFPLVGWWKSRGVYVYPIITTGKWWKWWYTIFRPRPKFLPKGHFFDGKYDVLTIWVANTFPMKIPLQKLVGGLEHQFYFPIYWE